MGNGSRGLVDFERASSTNMQFSLFVDGSEYSGFEDTITYLFSSAEIFSHF